MVSPSDLSAQRRIDLLVGVFIGAAATATVAIVGIACMATALLRPLRPNRPEPEPEPSKTLQLVLVLHRHGARYPNKVAMGRRVIQTVPAS
jgi:hypothetical protein